MPKKEAAPNERVRDSTMLGEVYSHPHLTEDDVFGEITSDGPNYRAVRIPYPQMLNFYTDYLLGRMAGNCRPHDEDSDWSWCPLDPSSL